MYALQTHPIHEPFSDCAGKSTHTGQSHETVTRVTTTIATNIFGPVEERTKLGAKLHSTKIQPHFISSHSGPISALVWNLKHGTCPPQWDCYNGTRQRATARTAVALAAFQMSILYCSTATWSHAGYCRRRSKPATYSMPARPKSHGGIRHSCYCCDCSIDCWMAGPPQDT
jgi:hypothetical protein